MGQVIIDVPQDINRTYRFEDTEIGEELLQNLDELKKRVESESKSIIPPRRNNLGEDSKAVLGIWSDRNESAEEIARKETLALLVLHFNWLAVDFRVEDVTKQLISAFGKKPRPVSAIGSDQERSGHAVFVRERICFFLRFFGTPK